MHCVQDFYLSGNHIHRRDRLSKPTGKFLFKVFYNFEYAIFYLASIKTHTNFILPYIFQITKLKIDSNPFAKGFRDSSRLSEIERLVWLFMLFLLLSLDIEMLAGGFDYHNWRRIYDSYGNNWENVISWIRISLPK